MSQIREALQEKGPMLMTCQKLNKKEVEFRNRQQLYNEKYALGLGERKMPNIAHQVQKMNNWMQEEEHARFLRYSFTTALKVPNYVFYSDESLEFLLKSCSSVNKEPAVMCMDG